MANYVYIATSIDGYIAAEDGGLDWLMSIPNPEDSDFGFAEFMDEVDAILMGRHTFETLLGFDEWIYTKPVFVLSSTLKEVPEAYRGKVELLSGGLRDVMDALAARGYANLYIDGGITIQRFLEEDLIDELIITLIPVVLGKGIPLFAPMDRELKFRYVSTNVYNGMLVKNRYTRIRE